MADIYENQPPEKLQGKYKAMIVCCILGIGSLVSWNSMLTIADYYYQVFPTYHPSRVLPLIYQPFALGTILILAYHESKINTRKRILTGYILFTFSTLLLILLDLATKGHGGIGHYICLCTIVASFGIADATVKGGIIGDLSLMCPQLLQSLIAGSGAAGVLTSSLRLITKAAFEKSNDRLRKGATSEGSKTVAADLAAAGIQTQPNSNDDESKNQTLTKRELLQQNIDHAINLFLIYVLTLSIFPGFLYENTGQHGLGSWYALVLVTFYNFWDLVGRYTPLINWLKIENRTGLTVMVLSRYILIPAFYFTAKYGDKGWMSMLISVLGLTTGHLTVCIITIAPKGYKGPEKNALGNLLVIFILGGALIGICLGWLWLIGKTNVL